MQAFRCSSSFYYGVQCHDCPCAKGAAGDPASTAAAKAFISDIKLPVQAVVVNRVSELPVVCFSVPIPEKEDFDWSLIARIKLNPHFDDICHRICVVVPHNEVKEFLSGFDVKVNFSPVCKRLERMETDVADIRGCLYEIGEHQTKRATTILKEIGQHEQH